MTMATFGNHSHQFESSSRNPALFKVKLSRGKKGATLRKIKFSEVKVKLVVSYLNTRPQLD